MSYSKEKLSDILIRMNLHEGNANMRLASEAEAICRLIMIPSQYKEKMDEFKELIRKTKKLYGDGIEIYKFPGLTNRKAVEYIRLLNSVYDNIE